jgi:hypothetical protein
MDENGSLLQLGIKQIDRLARNEELVAQFGQRNKTLRIGISTA